MIKGLVHILISVLMILPVFSQDYQEQRRNMVRKQLQDRGINHQPTLGAMRKVERHLFVPFKYQGQAYEDTPLPIGFNQTISQPYMVALMTQLLQPDANDKVLEIGTGSGYQAAVLAEIVGHVYTIEIIKHLGERSKKLLNKLGYKNVEVIIGDGYKGHKARAPYDAIIVTAAIDKIPPPLIQQLKEGGKLVIPVGSPSNVQDLLLVEKTGGKIKTTKVVPVRFVPFVRENE